MKGLWKGTREMDDGIVKFMAVAVSEISLARTEFHTW